MIISHKYKFIFLRTTKTAGTSLAIALSKYCDEGDVITGTGNEEDLSIRQQVGSQNPQNCEVPLWRYRPRELYERFTRKRKLQFHEHMSASAARPLVGEKIWQSYYKFCFTRNPWDRAISYYHFICSAEPQTTLSDYIATQAHMDNLNQRGIDIYTINGEVAVNKVYQFENLAEATEDIRKIVGIPEKISLPKAKSQYRKDRQSYHTLLKWHEVDRIAKHFSKEIELFDYTYR
jgi:hypothetical protein